ncbi:MAG: glycosyltransferase family 9 protein [Phycisphaerales bacterium]
MTAPLDGVERLLVVAPSWVGDAVMATPLLRALRAARPAARIAALVKPGLEEVLAGSPWLDETFAVRPGVLWPWRGLGPARRFRAQAVLLLPNSFRSALAALPLAPRRIGRARDGRSWLLTHRLSGRTRGPVPAVDWYADLGEFALGATIADRRPELHVTAAEAARAEELLKGASGPLIVLNPGANREDKRWPAERFGQVGARLADQFGAAVAVTGSPAERPVLERVVAAYAAAPGSRPALLDLQARGVRLGSLKGVLRRASLLISNDTGPRHLAIGLGTPVVSLFGPTDHRWTTIAGAVERRLLAEPFLPEQLAADDVPAACRIDRISPEDVRQAAAALLGAA